MALQLAQRPEKAELLRSFEGMYSDDYGYVRLYSAKVVTTRKAQTCPGYWRNARHDIAPGSVCVVERALVDDKWASCYTCETCIKDWRGECNSFRR